MKTGILIFATFFTVALGERTIIAAMLIAVSDEFDRLTVFVGASLALVFAAAAGIYGGGWLLEQTSEEAMRALSGVALITLGVWSVYSASLG